MADSASDGSDIDVSDGEYDQESSSSGEIMDPIDRGMVEDDMLMYSIFDSDDDDEDFEGFDIDWQVCGAQSGDGNGSTGPIPRYKLNPGSQTMHPPEARAVDYFSFFYDDEMWNHLVNETNRYANDFIASHPLSACAPKWKNVDVPTMKAFVGLTLMMGILKLPHR